MSKNNLGMIEQIGFQVERAAGQEVARQVMAGFESLTPKSTRQQVTGFVKQAMDRLDTLTDAPTRNQAMAACGANCARINHISIQRGVARRAKHPTEEAFLEAEFKKPAAGMRLEWDGDVLYQVYTPANFTRPLRCYCALMNGLALDEAASHTYCRCSQGFVQTYWQEVLGRPVEVEVLETAISGGSECRFRIGL